MSLNYVSINESESRFSYPVPTTNESRVSLKNSTQPEFIIHGRTLSKWLRTVFPQIVKECDMKTEFIQATCFVFDVIATVKSVSQRKENEKALSFS